MKKKSLSPDEIIEKQVTDSDTKYLSRDEIVEKQVIDSNAKIVGNVKEVTFDISRKTIALTVTPKEGDDIIIEGNKIAAMEDVILLKPLEQSPSDIPTMIKEQLPTTIPATPTPTTPGLCNQCKYQNDINAKFCIKCGTILQ